MNGIAASFPDFEPIMIRHKDLIESRAARYGHYSDFNFVSLLAWNTDGSTGVCLLNDNLVVRLPGYVDSDPVYSIFGDTDIDDSLARMLRITDFIELVPEITAASIENKDAFVVVEDPDNHDYVYDLALHVDLRGKSFKHVREHRNKFVRELASEQEVITTVSHALEKGRSRVFLDLFDEWVEQRDGPTDDAINERIALSRLLNEDIGSSFLVTETAIAGDTAAFSIYECLEDHYAIMHFSKARRVHRAFTPYLIQRDAEILTSLGYRRVNWEQDLGIPGLRAHKLAYQPVEMLRKYRIRRAE